MKKIPNTLKTFGKSMSPLLHDGDVIKIKKIPYKKIKINDIICVNKNKTIFSHRVIYKTDKFLITRGDYNSLSDGKVHPQQVIGKIDEVKRNGTVFNIDTHYLLQSTFYFKQILRVKKALEKNKIDYLFLKGLPLHMYLEKKHPRRIYADCDLLIDRKQFKKIESIFKKMGYVKKKSDLITAKKEEKDMHEISFYKKIEGFYVEFDIHLEIVFMLVKIGNMKYLYPNALLNNLTNKFLKEKTFIILRDEEFPILSYENMFINLTLHLFNHDMHGAYRYDFIEGLVNSKKLNYLEISNTILDFRLNNFIYPPLYLLKKYYTVSIPTSFIKGLSVSKSTISLSKKLTLSNIVDDPGRLDNGINRFKNVLSISPAPTYQKVFVFWDLSIVRTIFAIILVKMKTLRALRFFLASIQR